MNYRPLYILGVLWCTLVVTFTVAASFALKIPAGPALAYANNVPELTPGPGIIDPFAVHPKRHHHKGATFHCCSFPRENVQ